MHLYICVAGRSAVVGVSPKNSMSFPHSRQISGLTESVIDQNLIRDWGPNTGRRIAEQNGAGPAPLTLSGRFSADISFHIRSETGS